MYKYIELFETQEKNLLRYPQIWDKKVKISGETVAWIPKSLQHYNIPKIYYLDTLIYEYIELFGTQGEKTFWGTCI